MRAIIHLTMRGLTGESPPRTSLSWQLAQKLRSTEWSLEEQSGLDTQVLHDLHIFAIKWLGDNEPPRDPHSATMQPLLDAYADSTSAVDAMDLATQKIARAKESLRGPFSLTRDVAEQSLAIMLQMSPTKERADLGGQISPLRTMQYSVYGLLFWQDGPAEVSVRVSLTHSDLDRLQKAAESLVAVMVLRSPYYFGLSKPSSGRFRAIAQYREKIESIFGSVLVRTVQDEPVLEGEVAYYPGRASLARSLVFSGPSRIYYGLGVILTAVSAVLYFALGLAGTAGWVDGLVGRLATSLVGAALVQNAIEFIRVRGDLRFRSGKRESTTLIRWKSRLPAS